ncbi:MAG: pyruvate kinase [Gammaproteobacteria bacterium]
MTVENSLSLPAMTAAPGDLPRIGAELDALIDRVRRAEHDHAAELAACAPAMRGSARNLVHYLALRQVDLRPLQAALRALGLSSLGRLEACVLRTLLTVRNAVRGLAGEPIAPIGDAVPGYAAGDAALAARREALFGPPRDGRDASIMVTMPSSAAADPGLFRALAEAGMDVARINSAHDGPDAWRAMLEHARTVGRADGRRLRVSIDLAGPKLRTGPPATTIQVQKLKPRRGPRGEVVAPRRVGADELPLPAQLRGALQSGDRLALHDCRGRWRVAEVVAAGEVLALLLAHTVYLESGAPVRLHRNGRLVAEGRLGTLPPVEQPLRVERSTRVRVLRRSEPDPAKPAAIGCTLPRALDHVAVGQQVWFDDGHIGGRVSAVDDAGIDVDIDHVKPGGAWLRAGKGINLPDTRIDLPALSAEDHAVLAGFATAVDLVGLSFVQSPDDVLALHAALATAGATDAAVMLKIETRRAFEALPRILLAAMRRGPFAVMVARGDLAVEVGFERLAEVQEEILWLCEAAHAPVVWATQVLEDMAKNGLPSRAEVTDAAMAERAECVMLNKGPFIVETVDLLDGVLRRMQAHQHKKSAMLRRLAVSDYD